MDFVTYRENSVAIVPNYIVLKEGVARGYEGIPARELNPDQAICVAKLFVWDSATKRLSEQPYILDFEDYKIKTIHFNFGDIVISVKDTWIRGGKEKNVGHCGFGVKITADIDK